MLFKMMDSFHQSGRVFQKCDLVLMDFENNGSMEQRLILQQLL